MLRKIKHYSPKRYLLKMLFREIFIWQEAKIREYFRISIRYLYDT